MGITNLFLIKGSPSKNGVGASILDRIKNDLCEEKNKKQINIYDQAFENNMNSNKAPSLAQFMSSSSSDITSFEENIMNSDGFIVTCPVYLRHMPGIFKSTLDCFSYRAHEFPLIGKKVVIFTYGSSNGANDLARYFQLVFSSMGAEIVSVQFCHLIDESIENQMELLKENIYKMLDKINKNNYVVTEKQEQLFKIYKNIVLKEIENGIVTSKHEKWQELLPFENLVSYLENVKID